MNIIREIQKRWFPKTLKCIYRKDILEYVLKHHKYSFGGNHSCLCASILNALKHYNITTLFMELEVVFPLFTNNNANSLFNARSFNGGPYETPYNKYWWPKGEWDSGRLGFLKWLIEQYKDDKTNLKEL